MCHDQFHRARAWDREDADAPDEDDTVVHELDEEWDPSFASDEEPDESIEVLTDGGDEA